jgi:hypothetical protein
MSHRKPPERRTFLQDRFDILIKKQKNGDATFNELTELDDIVNRDPDFEEPIHPANNDTIAQPIKNRSLLNRIKSLISRIFNAQMLIVKTPGSMQRSALLSF